MMRRERGSTALEFVLVGIPMMFILFSLFEAARGDVDLPDAGVRGARGDAVCIDEG